MHRNPPPVFLTDLYLKYEDITNTSNLLMFYDGTFYNLRQSLFRMSARHAGNTMNALLFDGHVENVSEDDLPNPALLTLAPRTPPDNIQPLTASGERTQIDFYIE